MANDIEELIKQTANDILALLNNKNLQTKRLICPKDEKGVLRISEQEFKQLFIENICKQTDYNYSTETPSYYAYRFSEDKKKPQILEHDKISKTSLSSRIDLTLYESGNHDKKYHIEFKNEQVSKNSIKKDILKLAFEPNEKSHFVHVIVRNDDKLNKNTIDTLKEKFSISYDYAKDTYGNQFSLQPVVVFIVFVYGKLEQKNLKIIKTEFSQNSIPIWEDFS